MGLDLRRHIHRDRAHPAAAGKDRAGPHGAPADRHGLGRRVPLRTRRSMTGIDAPTLWQVTYTVAGVAVAAAAAGLLCVRLLARRSLATLLFVVAAVVIVSSMAGVGVIAYKMMISVDDRNVVLAVVIIAGLAGFAVALLGGPGVTAASRVLLEAVRDVGSVGYYEPPDAHLPAEFSALFDELALAHENLPVSLLRETG